MDSCRLPGALLIPPNRPLVMVATWSLYQTNRSVWSSPVTAARPSGLQRLGLPGPEVEATAGTGQEGCEMSRQPRLCACFPQADRRMSLRRGGPERRCW